MKKLLLAGFAFSSSLLLAADAPVELEAGEWEIERVLVSAEGLNVDDLKTQIGKTNASNKCLKAKANISDLFQIEGGVDYYCKVQKLVTNTQSGSTSLQLQCDDGKLSGSMRFEGVVRSTQVAGEMSAAAKGVEFGKPTQMIAKAKFSARRVGDCPPQNEKWTVQLESGSTPVSKSAAKSPQHKIETRPPPKKAPPRLKKRPKTLHRSW